MTTPPAPRFAVIAMGVASGFLVAAEFLPVSLLTPIARDFAITEGRAGLAIAISGVFAVLTSLLIVALTARMDRRLVVTGCVAVLALSALIAGFAQGFGLFLFARALVGIAVGGFWSFSTATVMRLVPPDRVAVSIAFLGSCIAFAGTVSAPLASLAGDVIGWRMTLLGVAPLGVGIGIWLWVSLPDLPPRGLAAQRANPLRLLARGQVRLAMAATALVFMGQFAIFTYIRPFLESVTGLSVGALSGTLLALGLAGVAGSWVVGHLLKASLFAPLILLPAALAGIGTLIALLGQHPVLAVPLFVAWGLVATAAPVGWGVWLSHALPSEAEQGGGLQVAVIQTAIALGAALGGVALDRLGWTAVYGLGVACLLASSGLALLSWSRFPHPAGTAQ